MTRTIPNAGCSLDDKIKLSFEGLGELSNTIIKEDADYSILKMKKNNALHNTISI